MDIAGYVEKLVVCFDPDSLERALKERPHTFVLDVEILCITILDICHEFLYALIGVLADEEMEMVGHQAVGEDRNAVPRVIIEAGGNRFFCCLRECVVSRERHGNARMTIVPKCIRHALVFAFLRENSPALNAAIEYVIRLIIGKYDGAWRRHVSIMAISALIVNRMFKAI